VSTAIKQLQLHSTAQHPSHYKIPFAVIGHKQQYKKLCTCLCSHSVFKDCLACRVIRWLSSCLTSKMDSHRPYLFFVPGRLLAFTFAVSSINSSGRRSLSLYTQQSQHNHKHRCIVENFGVRLFMHRHRVAVDESGHAMLCCGHAIQQKPATLATFVAQHVHVVTCALE